MWLCEAEVSEITSEAFSKAPARKFHAHLFHEARFDKSGVPVKSAFGARRMFLAKA